LWGQLGNGEVAVLTPPNTRYDLPKSLYTLTPADSLLGQDATLIAVTLAPVSQTLAPNDTRADLSRLAC
jgi:hypothetical protein